MSLVVSIVGRFNSGKTSLLEKLIVKLKKRGYSVAAVKHARVDFQLDYPGEDTRRLTETGSDTALVSSPHELALMKKPTHPLEDMLKSVGHKHNSVLIEGLKEGDTLKTEGHRESLGGLVIAPEKLFASVGDEEVDVQVPGFSNRDSVALVHGRSAVGGK